MGSQNRESRENREIWGFEQKPATIRLEFFRHDEKGKATTSGDRTGDEFVRLTNQGRANATKVGKEKNPNPNTAIAFGSPRERSMEAAMRQMLANEDAITPDSTLEDIRALVDQNTKAGSVKKEMALAELNFNWDSNQEFHDAAYRSYLETKNQLVFLYRDSDDLVRKNKDMASSSYSRAAAGFAGIVKKYLGILPRWEKIIKQDPDKYKMANNQMERYFGTHSGALETFLMKVIEKSRSKKELEKFLQGPKKNGFGLSEGFTVSIQELKGKPQILLTYAEQTYQIPPEMLDEIIQEGVQLDEEIQKAS